MLPRLGFSTARARHALRWLSRFALAGYLLATLGPALPISWSDWEPIVGLSEPYPCMNGACGCRSADQCWRSCCCHTLSERIAWARRHGVQPPEFVLKRLPVVEQQQLAKNHCGNPVSLAAYQKTAKSACCAASMVHVDAQQTLDPTVVLLRSLGCRGVDQDWLGLPVSLPTLVFSWSGSSLPGDWLQLLSEAFDTCERQPPSPPPQAA